MKEEIDYKTAYETAMIGFKMQMQEIERINKQIEEYQKALDETTSKKIDLENIIKEVRADIEDVKSNYFKRYNDEVCKLCDNILESLESLDKEL